MKNIITKLFILFISLFLATFFSKAYGQTANLNDSTAVIIKETNIEVLTKTIDHFTTSISIRLYATEELTRIRLLDAEGNMIKAFTLDVDEGWNNIVMNIGDLSAGKYSIFYKNNSVEKSTDFVKS